MKFFSVEIFRVQVDDDTYTYTGQTSGNLSQPSKAITVINFTQVRVASFGKGLTNEMVVSGTISLMYVNCAYVI